MSFPHTSSYQLQFAQMLDMVVMIGEEEATQNKVVLKCMASGKQEIIHESNVLDALGLHRASLLEGEGEGGQR